MNQDTSYPDPKQLQTFAKSPSPFHSVDTWDLDLSEEDDKIRAEFDNVTYVYHPTYLREENGEGGALHEYPEWHDMIEYVWENAINFQIEEDFIVIDVDNYHAYWLLEEISIESPEFN